MQCSISNDIDRYINQISNEAALEEHKQSLIRYYRELILNGATVVLNRITYSFDDVISDAAHAESIDKPLMALLRGEEQTKNIKQALEFQLEKLLKSMAESRMEEEQYDV